jgi:hypothetical protein
VLMAKVVLATYSTWVFLTVSTSTLSSVFGGPVRVVVLASCCSMLISLISAPTMYTSTAIFLDFGAVVLDNLENIDPRVDGELVLGVLRCLDVLHDMVLLGKFHVHVVLGSCKGSGGGELLVVSGEGVGGDELLVVGGEGVGGELLVVGGEGGGGELLVVCGENGGGDKLLFVVGEGGSGELHFVGGEGGGGDELLVVGGEGVGGELLGNLVLDTSSAVFTSRSA